MAEVTAFVNSKPGTGKSTTAVWFAHACHEAGETTALVDGDPGGSRGGTTGSSFRWSEALANPERPDGGEAFPFVCVPLPARDLHKRGPQIVGGVNRVVVDAPQMEDHAGIARSAIMWSTQLVIPVAPSPIELERMGGMRQELEDIEPFLRDGHQVFVLLNRVAPSSSTRQAREFLAGAGWTVLDTEIRQLVEYQRSWGNPVYDAADTEFGALHTELAKRRAER